MVKLKIIKKLQYNTHILQNIETNEQYQLALEFHNGIVVDVGDILEIDPNLLNPNYECFCQPYAFGITNNPQQNNPNFAALYKANTCIALKRLFG